MQVDDELYLIKTKESGHRALSSTYFNASSFIGCWSSQFHNVLLCLDNMPSIIWAQYLIVSSTNERIPMQQVFLISEFEFIIQLK